jgi:heat shock protein beta
MRKRLVRKIFDMIEEIADKDDKEEYKTFWENFGRNMRYGVLEDSSSHSRIAPLLRFFSNKSETDLTSLDAYVDRMKEGQKAIYFLAAESITSAKSAPFLEQLAKKDLEVLFLTEAIEEPMVGQLKTYRNKNFVDVSKEDLDLGDDEKDKDKDEQEKEYTALCDWIKQQLGEKVAKVQVSRRLASSPCVLVAGKFGWSANMEKLMRAQMRDRSEMEYMRARRILEINPDHPIIKDLKVQSEESPESSRAKQMVSLLHQTAMLASGFTPENPAEFGSKIYEMMALTVAAEETSEVPNMTTASSGTGEVVEAAEMREETDPWKQ